MLAFAVAVWNSFSSNRGWHRRSFPMVLFWKFQVVTWDKPLWQATILSQSLALVTSTKKCSNSSQSPSGHENGYHIVNTTTLSEIQTEWLPAAKAVIGGIMYLSFCSPILLVPALLKLALPKLLFSESWMVEKDFKKLSWPR